MKSRFWWVACRRGDNLARHMQDRKVGFSESGRLQVDVKLASFATRARGRVQQVFHMHAPYES